MTVLRSVELSVEGVGTPVVESGDAGASEAIVFVHGNPGSHRDWDLLLAETGALGRALAFDMPGFGSAGVPSGWDYEVSSYGRFLGAALEQLGVERAHLVLHDFGGPFGLAWAAAHRDALASVVLIDTGILVGYRGHRNARIWRTPILGELFQLGTTRGAMHSALTRGQSRPLSREYIDQMYDDYDSVTRQTVLRLYRVNRSSDDAALEQQRFFAALDRPALVVWGGEDPYLPVLHAEQQRHGFPSAEIEILTDSGHWPFRDDPERVGGLVTGFLRRQLAGSPPTGS